MGDRALSCDGLRAMAHLYPLAMGWAGGVAGRVAKRLAGGAAIALGIPPSLAQSLPLSSTVIPDQTLPTAVALTSGNGQDWQIQGGLNLGSNQFYSFQQFSIGAGQSLRFETPAAVQAVLARVGGGAVSQLEGGLSTAAGVDLFLLNPAGIVMGPGAQLQIGGSFWATTAERFRWADGSEFGWEQGQSRLDWGGGLTLSVPVGVQWGQTAGAIASLGQLRAGGDVVLRGGSLQVSGLVEAPGGLLQMEGKTGAVQLDQFQGQVGLLSVQAQDSVHLSHSQIQVQPPLSGTGTPALTEPANAATLSAPEIHLNASQILSLNRPGLDGYPIRVEGRSLTLQHGAQLLSEAQGSGQAGNLSIFLQGTATQPSQLTLQGDQTLIESLATGNAASGTIQVAAEQVWLGDRAALRTSTTDQLGGTIQVSAEHLTLTGAAQMRTRTLGRGMAGNIQIQVGQLNVVGTGQANPSQQILRDTIAQGYEVQVVGSGRPGGAAFLIRDAQGQVQRLSVAQVQQVSENQTGIFTSSFGQLGNAGDVSIWATNGIDLSQEALISTTGWSLGGAGNMRLEAPTIRITDAVAIALTVFGSGALLDLSSDRLLLDRGLVVASTVLGQGGNLSVQANQAVVMQRDSHISARAFDTGQGGNVSLRSPLILGQPGANTDITANARQGRGGSIQIVSSALWGLTPRSILTPDSDITASSELGLGGNVSLAFPEAPFTVSPTPLPDITTLKLPTLRRRCLPGRGGPSGLANRLLVSGRGGVVPGLTLSSGWVDWRRETEVLPKAHPWDPSSAEIGFAKLRRIARPDLTNPALGLARSPALPRPTPPFWQEATTWQSTPSGQIQLLAAHPVPVAFDPHCEDKHG